MVDDLRIFFFVLFLSRHPVVYNNVLNRIGYCLKNLLFGSFFQRSAVKSLDIVQYGTLKKLFVKLHGCFFQHKFSSCVQ